MFSYVRYWVVQDGCRRNCTFIASSSYRLVFGCLGGFSMSEVTAASNSGGMGGWEELPSIDIE